MSIYSSVIEELERETASVALLSHALNLRQVRVTRHPAGGSPVDITKEYEIGLRKASDALLKAVAALKSGKT
jgi:hypothetical protein